MKILINYADENYKNEQKRNSYTGIKNGGFDKVIEFSPEKLDQDFLEQHSSFISNNKRGGGYWIWKPFIILKTLKEVADFGDFIFYCDSGSMFINTIDYLIVELEKSHQDIFLTEIPLIEYQWTKYECFKKLNCLDNKYLYSNQVQSGFILIKKTKSSIEFFEKYISVCVDYSNINDDWNKDINRDLIDHRHDQSILSLLAKKASLELFRDISQYGTRPWQYINPNLDFNIKKYRNSNYPQIVNLYRKDNWYKVLIKERIKDLIGVKLRQ
ncbi:hypothetical protein [Fictibacillus sp. KU28468]|uniref:hypothetical protein n=1 Tax=Fictibacillus sp. KU28468 TaxID=2991053 RepID=UPI00223D14FF|nr:hypothetical protein [Fictibacillus sp. KU28468]UZJ79341.1 hypothetical protein OKX00_02290 [Fictibacillus sp. KU28468]